MRMSRSQLRKFRVFLAQTHPQCQICGAQAVEAHHVIYGCYKDDAKQISVCRACHEWCHAHKHESIEKYERLADENWANFQIQS